MRITDKNFFSQRAENFAPALLGKFLCRKIDSQVYKYKITETEAYSENDSACHAYKGKTKRTKILWEQGGHLYVYLCYGIHEMLNIVAGEKNQAEGVLIRGIEGFCGPGKVTKELNIDRSFYGENLIASDRIWIEDNDEKINIKISKRIGIEYAKEEDRNKLLRFYI